jgi:putative Mg2+ transporter-C (MgtC) family protein
VIGLQEFGTNLGVALGLGALIGIEREARGREAGLRTNALVTAGAAIFTMVSNSFPDTSRIAAQIVTGIGFLGAGTILKAGEHIRGLTTAATLWVVAGIGMLAGMGQLTMATITTVAVLVVNIALFWLEGLFRRRETKPDV